MESPTIAPVSRRNLLKAGGAAAVASALGLRHHESFADGVPLPTEQITRGGVFRLRIDQAPVHFDPHQTAAASTMIPLSFAYSRLMRVSAGTGVVPGTQDIEMDVADEWDRQGETVYVFKLRRGVYWHAKPPVNGRELVAEDVKYTYQRFLTMKGNPNRSLLEMIDKIETPDKYTVKFTLKEPDAWFVDRLASTSAWIIAKECVEKFGDLKRWESMVGTGPFVLDRYEPNAKFYFARTSYFVTDLPFVDAVELAIDPDPAAAFAG